MLIKIHRIHTRIRLWHFPHRNYASTCCVHETSVEVERNTAAITWQSFQTTHQLNLAYFLFFSPTYLFQKLFCLARYSFCPVPHSNYSIKGTGDYVARRCWMICTTVNECRMRENLCEHATGLVEPS